MKFTTYLKIEIKSDTNLFSSSLCCNVLTTSQLVTNLPAFLDFRFWETELHRIYLCILRRP